MATLAGMVVGLGLVLAVRAVRPAPPSLAAALSQRGALGVRAHYSVDAMADAAEAAYATLSA